MPSSPSHPRPRHKPYFARTALRRCLPALCLGLALLAATPPASAASLHEFVTRWGKTTVSSWPPAAAEDTAPSANGTHSTVVPAAEDTRQPGTERAKNATAPVTEPHTTSTPAATTDQGHAMDSTVHNAVTPTAGSTHKPATESAQNAAVSTQAKESRSQPPPAHPAPEARQSVALPDGMPSSLLGNLHAPMATPPAQQ